METPVVTVVTPSFNQGGYIEETIRSVLSQEGDFELEHIVMDGGSTDATIGVLKKYEALVREGRWPVRCKKIEFRWVSEKDRGQAHAVNKGFAASGGEILGWLNSDDTYEPGAVEKAVRFLERDPGTGIVYGQGWHIDERGKRMDKYDTEPFDIERLAETCFICQPAVFMRRRVLDEVGLLDEGLNYCMDYDYWIRAGRGLKLAYMTEHLANTRLYPDTKTMSRAVEAHEEIIGTVKRHYGRVPNRWMYAYARLRAQRVPVLSRIRPAFKLAWAAFFVLKHLEVNKRLPHVPFSDIRALARRP